MNGRPIPNPYFNQALQYYKRQLQLLIIQAITLQVSGYMCSHSAQFIRNYENIS